MNNKAFISQQSVPNLNICFQNMPTSGFADLSHWELVNVCINSSSTHPAWREFYTRYHRLIHHYICKFWKRPIFTDVELIADLTQEVFVRLLANNLQALKKFIFNSNNNFLGYLQAITHHMVIDYFRHHSSQKKSGKEYSLQWLSENVSDPTNLAIIFKYLSYSPNTIFDHITEQEFFAFFDKVVRSRNIQLDKLIFKLYALEGLSMLEISQLPEINLSLGCIESRISRIRKQLFKACAPFKIT